jgi:hypothetical protein
VPHDAADRSHCLAPGRNADRNQRLYGPLLSPSRPVPGTCGAKVAETLHRRAGTLEPRRPGRDRCARSIPPPFRSRSPMRRSTVPAPMQTPTCSTAIRPATEILRSGASTRNERVDHPAGDLHEPEVPRALVALVCSRDINDGAIRTLQFAEKRMNAAAVGQYQLDDDQGTRRAGTSTLPRGLRPMKNTPSITTLPPP